MASRAYEVVDRFEDAMAEFCGAPYAVAVESCSAALYLCCECLGVRAFEEIHVPKITYPSVPAAVIHAGGRVAFKDEDWQERGWYWLDPLLVADSAKRIDKNMFLEMFLQQNKIGNDRKLLVCLSFHGKKCLKIGRGGMILTNDEKARDWLKLARFDGRHACPLPHDTIAFAGWNLYMTCEQAARGLELLQFLPDKNIDPPDKYQDLSVYNFYKNANRQQQL